MKAAKAGCGLPPRFFFQALAGEVALGAQAATGAEAAEPSAGAAIRLDEADSHHLTRVLRLRPGDLCEAVWLHDPTKLWKAEVEETGAGVILRLLGEPEAVPADPLQVAVAQALPQPAKVDEVVEKGTEVGVDLFLLFPSAGSPAGAGGRAARRLPRWRKQAREAAKQSRQMSVPQVQLEQDLPAVLERLRREGWRSLVLEPAADVALAGWVRGVGAGGAGYSPVKLALWIGPESGWTAEEMEELREGGCAGARLGRRILRTETAGPVAAAVLRFALHSW